jgi:molybdopterin synthase catalytic subunit
MAIGIIDGPFDPWQRLADYQRQLPQGQYGATAVFVGTMRDFNEGDDVDSMLLEHYPGMTEKYLQQICEKAAERWSILDSLVLHRVGPIQPNDPIVLVAVWSVHRVDAYEANRFLMDELKSRAPFWKKESTLDGGRWVEHNTPGYRSPNEDN